MVDETPPELFTHYITAETNSHSKLPVCIRAGKCAIREQKGVATNNWREVTCPECKDVMYAYRLPNNLKWWNIELMTGANPSEGGYTGGDLGAAMAFYGVISEDGQTYIANFADQLIRDQNKTIPEIIEMVQAELNEHLIRISRNTVLMTR